MGSTGKTSGVKTDIGKGQKTTQTLGEGTRIGRKSKRSQGKGGKLTILAQSSKGYGWQRTHLLSISEIRSNGNGAGVQRGWASTGWDARLFGSSELQHRLKGRQIKQGGWPECVRFQCSYHRRRTGGRSRQTKGGGNTGEDVNRNQESIYQNGLGGGKPGGCPEITNNLKGGRGGKE